MAKKRELIPAVKMTGLADRGKAVGRSDQGLVVFVPDVVPGDVVDVRLLRKRKGAWQGVAERIVIPSPDRVEARCRHFADCGGCKWQHLKYEAQLREKEQMVKDAFTRIAHMPNLSQQPILQADPIFRYRNKIEYSFSAHRWKTKAEVASEAVLDVEGAVGLHPPGSFQKVVALEECWLQASLSNDIRNFVDAYARQNQLSYFDPVSHEGFLRNMILRNNLADQWMVIISFYFEDREKREALLEALQSSFPQISSLHYVINQKKNDTLFDQDIICYAGDDHIIEQLGPISYRIRPKSFFQTNTRQAQRLYDVIREYAEIESDDVVYDLYCGLGSITLYLADLGGVLVGMEEVEDAIIDARLNAQLNGFDHAHFFAGDVRESLTREIVQKYGSPDIVITDPPRGGMHAEVVEKINQLQPRRIVYVSCNPATQARDVALMQSQYVVEKLQPVDMFPHTGHIENVASLVRK